MKGPPELVRNVQIFNITPFGFEISWLPPLFDGYRPIISYDVHILDQKNITLAKPCETSFSLNYCIINATKARFIDLQPYTIYHLKVTALNVIGEGLGHSFTMQTDEYCKSSIGLYIIESLI